jgi:hypothetical protein
LSLFKKTLLVALFLLVSLGLAALAYTLTIDSLSVNNGSIAGGTGVTLSGEGFLPTLYTRTIEVTNSGATQLTDYQVSVTFETASLVSAGKMRSRPGGHSLLCC